MASATGSPSNAFAGNPLIPEKQDKASIPKLLPAIARAAAANGDASRCVLPVSEGKVLVWSRTRDPSDQDIDWGLAWQPLSALNISLPSSPSEEQEASSKPGDKAEASELGLDDLVYLGEHKGAPFFAAELSSDASSKVPSLASLTAPSPALQRLWAKGPTQSSGVAPPSGGGKQGDLPGWHGGPDGTHLALVDLRTLFLAGDPGNEAQMADLAIAGQARAYTEWHRQSRFCSACGARTAPTEAGDRRACTSAACGARVYPRVDPVVIMLILDPASERVCLGRQSRFPPGMWSCLAGFMEMGESLEESVRREVREEVGLEVDLIRYHSSQPWPVGFGNVPCQLMVGFYAEVSGTDITVDRKELEDARWFTREEVKKGLDFTAYERDRDEARRKIHSLGVPRKDGEPKTNVAPASQGAPTFYVPGPFAIAHTLLKDWALKGSEDVGPHSAL